MPMNFPFVVAFLPSGRPTLGLVATLRGSSFSLSRLGGIGHNRASQQQPAVLPGYPTQMVSSYSPGVH